MTFQPNEEYLKHITLLLENSTKADTLGHLQIQKVSTIRISLIFSPVQALNDLKTRLADYPCYLAHLFAHGKNASENVRAISGLALKKHLTDIRTLPPPMAGLITKYSFEGLTSETPIIRGTAGTLISVLFKMVDVPTSADLLRSLGVLLEAKNDIHIEV